MNYPPVHLYLLVLVLVLSFTAEVVDSGLGMMYGTLLGPILLIVGFDAYTVVPSILLSQAVGGIVGTVIHHMYGNADFRVGSQHFNVVLAIAVPGVVASFLGVMVGASAPQSVVKAYIGVLATVMGALCIYPLRYTFRWWKMYLVGLVSAFNKAMSGGGFGPIASTGKILGGLNPKASIATTTYAEVPICLTSFILWCLAEGFAPAWVLLSMCVGSVLGAVFGPRLTSNLNVNTLRVLVGALSVALGILAILGVEYT